MLPWPIRSSYSLWHSRHSGANWQALVLFFFVTPNATLTARDRWQTRANSTHWELELMITPCYENDSIIIVSVHLVFISLINNLKKCDDTDCASFVDSRYEIWDTQRGWDNNSDIVEVVIFNGWKVTMKRIQCFNREKAPWEIRMEALKSFFAIDVVFLSCRKLLL